MTDCPPNGNQETTSPAKCARGAARRRFNGGVDESEYLQWCATLGVEPGVTLEVLERVYLRKNLALIRDGTPAERETLRRAFEALQTRLQAKATIPRATGVPASAPIGGSQPAAAAGGRLPDEAARERFDPFSFDSRRVNLLALPVVTGLAWLANLSPFGFLLKGFHVWTHEFGHATVAWLTGRRALPLPIGWTSVEPEKSVFVYCGVLFLLGVFLAAGWRERKIWPIVIAGCLAPVQFYLTWRLSADRADLGVAWGGVGGEFALSTGLMLLFYVQLPEKFRWNYCRYVFLFIGASSWLNIQFFWLKVKHGTEDIPWGSMIHGEDSGGGDMNVLRDDYGWSNHDIIGTYTQLGRFCAGALLAGYVIFALRLDRVGSRWVRTLWRE